MPFVQCRHCGEQFLARRIHGPKGARWCSDKCRKRAKRAQEKAASGS